LILSSAWQIVTKACNQLMDRELSETERGRILSIAAGHAHVRAVHDLRTRKAGVRDFIQLHLEMDPQLPLIEAHRIADEVEQAILADFPRAEVIIHQDPAGLPEAHAMLARTP
jgi:ferrous-iron efflux pump FieF